MTTFQKWIVVILIGFGLLLFYFWRSDVYYNHCQKEFADRSAGKVTSAEAWIECRKPWWQP